MKFIDLNSKQIKEFTLFSIAYVKYCDATNCYRDNLIPFIDHYREAIGLSFQTDDLLKLCEEQMKFAADNETPEMIDVLDFLEAFTNYVEAVQKAGKTVGSGELDDVAEEYCKTHECSLNSFELVTAAKKHVEEVLNDLFALKECMK